MSAIDIFFNTDVLWRSIPILLRGLGNTILLGLTAIILGTLYFLVPLIGWAYSSAAGFPIVVFGVLPLPDFVPADKALAEMIKPFHELSAFALIGLAGLHIAAALKHQWIDRDGLINRMLPGRD